MNLFFADLVREACWGVGAGDLPLGGALRGHRRFADAVPPGARFPYVILSLSHPGEWEAGEGEIGSGDSLVRMPAASSNGGAAVAFSAGLKTVALALHAVLLDEQADALASKAEAAHDHDAAYQPLDADLSAISGLTTTAFGRGQLSLSGAAALRDHAGLGTLATQQANAVAISGGTVHGITALTVAGDILNTVGSGGTLILFESDGARINRLIAGADEAGAYLQSSYSSGGTGDLRIRCTGTTVATFLTGGGMNLNGALTISTPLALASGGTGASSEAAARSNLGLGTMATQASASYALLASPSFTGAPTHSGIEIGWRDLPRVTAGLERGKVLAAGADVTVPAGGAVGAAYRIYNDSGAAIMLTPGSGLTLHLAGSSAVGARTLAERGFATIWFNAADEAVASGAGVS